MINPLHPRCIRAGVAMLCLWFAGDLAVRAQNQLVIPPALSGTVFNLNIQNGTTQFFPGVNTPTYGINGPLLGPTLMVNKGDWVTMNVTNNLTGNGNSTTLHWHGLHVPAEDDGGPHQVINQGSTWSPQFEIMNSAGTFWYHSHGHNKTDLHVSKGLAGMLIVRDSAEAALTLPRTYGADDFPIIVQTKCFDVLNQIAIATVYDTVPMVNGVVNPYLQAPAQVVRFRLLNGSSDRSFLFGFSNNMNFHLIANDGGLLDSSTTLNRIRLSNGERAEILADLSALQNDTIYLMNYGSQLPNGIIGSPQVGQGMSQIPFYNQNPLNGADYNLLQIRIGQPLPNAVTTIPASLVPLNPWQSAQSNFTRNFLLAPQVMGPSGMVEGPFTINGHQFSMNTVNDTTFLNRVEIWNLTNQTNVAHPFHIHDMHFFILNVNGGPVPDYERGKKDVVLVMPQQTVSFITKFEDFADTMPYMYHCHLLHHEDDGMMGSFIVIDTTAAAVSESPSGGFVQVFPNPASTTIHIQLDNTWQQPELVVINLLGERVLKKDHINEKFSMDSSNWPDGVYIVRIRQDDRVSQKKIIKFNIKP